MCKREGATPRWWGEAGDYDPGPLRSLGTTPRWWGEEADYFVKHCKNYGTTPRGWGEGGSSGGRVGV